MFERISDTFNKSQTLVEMLRWHAENNPDKRVYSFLEYTGISEINESTVTYRELDFRARSIAVTLKDNRADGKTVLLVYNSGIEYIAAFWGCLYAGSIPVPAYPPHGSKLFSVRLESMIPNSGAEFALTTESIALYIREKFPQFFNDYKISWMTTDKSGKENPERWSYPDINCNSIAFIQYTSGSTATPKGVIVRYRNLFHNIALIRDCIAEALEGPDDDLKSVIWLPPYHDMGLIGCVLSAAVWGISLLIMSPFAFIQKPFRWLDVMSRYKAQISAAPNFAFPLCCEKISEEEKRKLDLSAWKIVFNGAEPVYRKTLEDFTGYFSSCGFSESVFYPCYGLAESTLIVTCGNRTSPVYRNFDKNRIQNNIAEELPADAGVSRMMVGCGKVLKDVELLIVNPESFKPCGKNEIGEIWLKSRSVADGYWNNETETAETFRIHPCGIYGGIHSGDTSEGFLRTGDLGFMYDSELFITGRLKDLIIINGKDINPDILERMIENMSPACQKNANAAFSCNIDNDEKIIVIQAINRNKSEGCDFGILKTLMQDAVKEEYDLDIYDILFVDPSVIHRTSSGKIQRRACKMDYLNKIASGITT